MKILYRFLLFMLVLIVSACGQRGNSSGNDAGQEIFNDSIVMEKTSILFFETEHDFGQVKEGKKVTCKYTFENTGNADLIILNAKATCGCTKPSYSKKPIAPGKTGSLEVTFNTKGRVGNQRKNVSITANTEPAVTVVSFICEVLPKDEDQ